LGSRWYGGDGGDRDYDSGKGSSVEHGDDVEALLGEAEEVRGV
jgi:hypothetical protein